MNARIVLICAFAVTTSCGGDGGGGEPPLPSKFLYASVYSVGSGGAISGAIYAFGVDPGGALSAVSGSPFAPTSDGAPIAITRDSKFLYSVDSATGKLLAFQIHSDGSLTAVPGAPFSTPDRPLGLVAHPTADFLYVSSDIAGSLAVFGSLTVFAIDSATGALSLTSSVTLSNDFTTNAAAITPDGRYLYQDGGYPSAPQIAGFSTNSATGALSAVPGSPLSPTNFAFFPGPMAVDPAGKFLYVSNSFEALSFGGPLAAYSIDAVSGALTAVPGSPFDVGGIQYYGVAIDASGRFLIVDITPKVPGNCLAVLSIDPDTGALTSVPGSPFGQICGLVAADPSEPYVYIGGNYGSPPGGGVYVLSMDQATGALTPMGSVTFPGNTVVSSIALTH